ncbi:MAG: hypothetical protein Q8T08_08310 [Ignavibacteria bacterium]|nr:hypothetical protein [Ignavibacteria bacterium]
MIVKFKLFVKYVLNLLMQSSISGGGKTIGQALKPASLLRIVKVFITEWLEIKPDVSGAKTDMCLHYS